MGVDPYEPMIDSTLAYIESVFPDYDYGLSKTDPAIVIAILNNDFEAFKALLYHGTNPNTRIFQDSSSLLHLACEIGNAEMAAYLISIGADDQCISIQAKRRSPTTITNSGKSDKFIVIKIKSLNVLYYEAG